MEHEIQTIESNLSEQLSSSIAISIAVLVVASFLLFLGARLVKPTLFLGGFGAMFLIALLGTDILVNEATGIPDHVSCILLGALPAALGLVGGLLALCLLRVGFFILGAGSGAGLGYVLYSVGLYRIPSPKLGSYDLSFVICLAACALIGAVALVRFQRSLLIVATSVAGAAAATPPIFLLLAHANAHIISAEWRWVQAVTAVVLTLVGLYVQCKCTSAAKAKKRQPNEYALGERTRPLMAP